MHKSKIPFKWEFIWMGPYVECRFMVDCWTDSQYQVLSSWISHLKLFVEIIAKNAINSRPRNRRTSKTGFSWRKLIALSAETFCGSNKCRRFAYKDISSWDIFFLFFCHFIDCFHFFSKLCFCCCCCWRRRQQPNPLFFACVTSQPSCVSTDYFIHCFCWSLHRFNSS